MEHLSLSYRFEGLLHAIEFFTQRFDMEQLSQYSFEFVNEILTLNASALFIHDGHKYVLRQKRLYPHIAADYVIRDTDKMKQLALFRGHTLTRGFEHFLEPGDIERLRIKWLMPLMVNDKLHGFIVSNGNIEDHFSSSDLVMSGTLMRLINNSLENSYHLAQLQASNAKLDQKNFNLLAINQSTKVLLSEMSLTHLYDIATDVFSEVTSSQVTSFGVVDPISGKLKITGFRNVLAYNRYYGEFELKSRAYAGPIVLHMERDRGRLDALFVNREQLKELETEYVILIVQKQLIGMVTLSRPVNDERSYDDATFELIESLANSSMIALSNATLFAEAGRQRTSAENKLRLLLNLNRLVSNVNESSDPEELCYFTIKTLRLAFGVRKALLCLREGDAYVVTEQTGFSWANGGTAANKPNADLKGQVLLRLEEVPPSLMDRQLLCDYTSRGAERYLPPHTLDWLEPGSTNCCVIAPLAVSSERVRREDPYPLGFLVILETESSLLEEEVLLLDTVAKNISPILHQMFLARSVQKLHKRDNRAGMLEAVKRRIAEWDSFKLEYFLYYKPYRQPPFAEDDWIGLELAALDRQAGSTSGRKPELYAFDGHLFALTGSPVKEESWIEIPHRYELEAVLSFSYPS
ncbi:GAF domain-containing protein [Paenibacillus puerhi]|uniref:GAF domain-containing protein n=1 Tax=Paenibacillus puerhi TaxID=2692622 RepID=UPI00135899A5|nr:GAF domain-containing protein [Paenibacillus puerhi]